MKQEGTDLDVTWLPFEIHPDTPAEGISLADYFGASPAQFEGMFQNLKRRADELGLPINPVHAMYNTHKALLLAEYVRDHYPERLDRLHHQLFAGYLVDGRNLAEDGVLADLCERVGVPIEAVSTSQQNQEYEHRLRAVMAEGQRMGITGTPTFVLADRYKIVGAQPYEVLRQAVQRIAAEGV